MNGYFFWLPIGLYLTAWIGEFVRYWSGHEERYRWSGGTLAVGWGAHTLLLAYVFWQHDVQVSTLLNAASWLSLILYYVLQQRLRGAVIRLVFPPFAIALLITAYLSAGAELLPPGRLGLSLGATRNLLTAHIISVLAGILLFGLACLASILYLYQEHKLKAKAGGLVANRLPSLRTLENYNHKAISLGFFFMTMGILLGLVVSGMNTLPHQFFSMRQVIPTLVWLVYAVFLLTHDLQGWRGRFGAQWSIVGFLVVISSLVAEVYFLVTRA